MLCSSFVFTINYADLHLEESGITCGADEIDCADNPDKKCGSTLHDSFVTIYDTHPLSTEALTLVSTGQYELFSKKRLLPNQDFEMAANDVNSEVNNMILYLKNCCKSFLKFQYFPMSLVMGSYNEKHLIYCRPGYLCQYRPDTPLAGEAVSPPFIIKIDFGDGTPVMEWSMENQSDIFFHGYHQPGSYNVAVTGINKNK